MASSRNHFGPLDVNVGALRDLRLNAPLRVVAPGGRAALVVRLEDGVRAVDDLCTHAGASLSEGRVEGCAVICPWHAGQFDLRDGQALIPPASLPLAVWAVSVREGVVWVTPPAS